jgi:hypothetical protein
MKEKQKSTSKKPILILVFSIILLFCFLSWDKIYYVVDKNFEKVGIGETDSGYYHRIASGFNKKSTAMKRGSLQIKDLVDNDSNFGYFGYFMNNMRISSNGSGTGGTTISIGSLENVNEDYRLIKDSNKKSDELGEYELGVSILNWFGGNSDNAIEILENVDYLKDEELKTTRNLNLAAMYIGLSRFEEAENLLIKDFKENDLYNYFKRDMLAYIYFFKGENDRFEKIISYKYDTLKLEGNSIKGVKFDEEEKYRLRGNLDDEIDKLNPYLQLFGELQRIFEDIEYNQKEHENMKSTDNALTGYVSYNGDPLRGVVVYVKSTKNQGMSLGGFVDMGIYGTTDKNGRYEIKNIPNDNYDICLYGSWNQLRSKQVKFKSKHIAFDGNTKINENIQLYDPIKLKKLEYIGKDKIEVTWENPAGNDFEYSVKFGEIQNTDYGGEYANPSYVNSIITRENFALIDLSQLRKDSLGNIFSWGNDFVEPYQVIEPFYHTGKYGLIINAYPLNKDYSYSGSDNYGIFANKRYDSIDIEGNDWNEGDKLLLEKRYPEALKWFENKLEEDMDDIHAMKVLSTIYSKGYKCREDGFGLIGKDVKKGIKYTELLKEDIGEKEYILSVLGDLYNSDGQYEKALEYYLKLAKVKAKDSYYEYSRAGNMCMKMNKWHKAFEYYKLYVDNYEYRNYAKVLLVGILMDNKETIIKYSHMIESEEYGLDYGELFNTYINMDRDRYKELYNSINGEEIISAKEILEKDESELGIFYRGLLLLSEMRRFDEEEEKDYYSLYKLQHNATLKSLMKYFGQQEIVSNFGERGYDAER